MVQEKNKNLVRFDWALKRLLRNKANYAVLEGFLSVLLNEDIEIIDISDPEGNKQSADDKFNRVDILVKNEKNELFIIELQHDSEIDYLLRMLYGVSKAITDHIKESERYRNIRKVYHINIVYFKLGQGEDYVYHGTTEFHGLHKKDILQLSDKQKTLFEKDDIYELFPEYYILRIDGFNDVAKDSLDEWIYFFKHTEIPDEFSAKGLAEARKVLQYDALSKEEQEYYLSRLRQERYEKNIIEDSHDIGHDEGFIEGHEVGHEEGLQKGLQKGREEGLKEGIEKGLQKGIEEGLQKGIEKEIKTALKLHDAGWTAAQIAGLMELSEDKVLEIIAKNKPL